MNKVAYPALIKQIGQLLQSGREKAAYAVNTVLLDTYWQIGAVHYRNMNKVANDKAVYGSNSY